MRAQCIVGIVVMAALVGCAAAPPTPGHSSLWPPLADNFGGFITTGHGILIHCHVSADPRILYYTVERSQGEMHTEGAALFLAGILSRKATLEGVSPLVLLGEFPSEAHLLFAMGVTEATGQAAAAQFQGVLPPGSRPARISAESEACVSHLGTLLGSLSDA